MDITLKISILGDVSIGKRKLLSSIKNIFPKNSTHNNDTIITYKYNQTNTASIVIEVIDLTTKITSGLKLSDLVLLCFRTDVNESFLNLYNWIKAMEDSKVKEYYLLGNDFHEPYYSLSEIKSESEALNDCFDLKYANLDFVDFGKEENLKKYFQSLIKKVVHDKMIKKEKCDGSDSRSCFVF